MFEFKRPSKYKKTNINVDKAIIYPERELDKKGIIDLASETGEDISQYIKRIRAAEKAASQ